ncbi:hypothetical protein DFJ63DRAFT_315899 [Scheffersomyces coipomensis]|uniref:uncharacterized protein n=1 Tax=Scheffersomyces coipomensis TaxID=1788519 RepID=UPI00315D5D3F
MANLYPLSTKWKFIFFYDAAATMLWFCCLARFLILLPLVGRRFLPGGIADFFHGISLIPLIGFFFNKLLLEPSFSLKDIWGYTNGIKMAWICYGVIFPHPKIAKHTSYSFLILSYCVGNLIHYSYYTFKTKTRASPRFLFWLEFSNFYLIYPISLLAEMILIFLSLEFVLEDSIYDYLLKFVLLAYVPIAYFTWGYLKRRRQVKYVEVIEKRERIKNSVANERTQPAATTAIPSIPEEIELREVNN